MSRHQQMIKPLPRSISVTVTPSHAVLYFNPVLSHLKHGPASQKQPQQITFSVCSSVCIFVTYISDMTVGLLSGFHATEHLILFYLLL